MWELPATAALIVVVAAVALIRPPAHLAHRPEAIPSFARGWSVKEPSGFEGIHTPVPFVGGRDLTLAQAEQFVGFQIPRPDDRLANDKQIQDVWVAKEPDEGGGTITQVRVVYSTGVHVELGPGIPSLLGDPVAQLGRFKEEVTQDAAQTGGQAQVTSVNGSPAYLVPQDAAMWANGESQGAPGEVVFYLPDHVLDVVGHMSDSDLLRIASSVSAPASQLASR
jgi:hypothetical protein